VLNGDPEKRGEAATRERERERERRREGELTILKNLGTAPRWKYNPATKKGGEKEDGYTRRQRRTARG